MLGDPSYLNCEGMLQLTVIHNTKHNDQFYYTNNSILKQITLNFQLKKKHGKEYTTIYR